MAMSENSVKVLNYLKENHGKQMTAADVAEALGLEKRTVDGVFNGLQRKGLGERVPGTVAGTKEVSFLSTTGEMPEDATLNENAEKIVAYLNEVAGQNVTLDDVAAAVELDKRVVNGSFNALVKKGICARTPATIEAPATVKYLTLTEEGLGYTE